MRKLLFAEYTDLNQAKFKDAKDIRTFTREIFECRRNSRLLSYNKAFYFSSFNYTQE